MRSVVDVPKADKGLTSEQKEHLRGVLQPIVTERFGGNATQAAKAMRLSQPQLSQILLGAKSARSAGVSALVRIRAFVGMSLDDLLGLPPLRTATEAPDDYTTRYKAALVELEQMIARQREVMTASPPATDRPREPEPGLPRVRRRP
jgi:transcriptional regulator with XRE-family HTH domain